MARGGAKTRGAGALLGARRTLRADALAAAEDTGSATGAGSTLAEAAEAALSTIGSSSNV
jgi:hypothetical protein